MTALTADPAFAEVKAMVIARTGHQYYADKDAQLAEHVARRMAERGDTPAAYRDRLRDPASDEWPLIESAVTINETFFFRFAEQFDALRRVILPGLIQRHRHDRRLRIWSVGCSTGAEAHSIAILLADLLGDAIGDWRIALTGTDIDEAALATARAADFSAWTLRTLGEAERDRMFDRARDRYRLKDRYRGIARFERLNILDMVAADAPLNFAEYDLILCRNVLIYFSHADSKRIVGALADRLGEDGLLLLGHAEPNPTFDAVADPVQIGGILAYRRLGSVERPSPTPVAVSAPTPVPKRVTPPRAKSPPSVALPPPPPGPPAAFASGDPAARYWAALGAMALGERETAERGFRDALYLDRSFAMAHYLLGRQLLASGRTTDGHRSLTNALRLADTLPADAELPEGDGMTAGAMVAAVRATLGAQR